jgi:ABC-type branched-subunit amino acid transport system substrate-binding protein
VPRTSSAALILAALLAVVASCRFPGSVRPTLKIGLVAPFEGRYRYVGYDVIYAVRLALREINEAGGIDGRGVELAAFDDAGDPALAAEQVRKLAVDPQVLGALGHFRRETTLAAADSYGYVGLPLLAVSGLDAGLDTGLDTDSAYGGSVFPVARNTEELGAALVRRAIELAPDRRVVLATDERGGPLAGAVEAAAVEQGLALTVVAAGREGWRQDVLGYYPEVLVCDADAVAAGEVVALLKEGGWPGDVLGGPPLSAADFAAVAGEGAVGAVFLTPWPYPRDVEGGQAFAEAYREVSGGSEPGPLAWPAFEATRRLLDAIDIAAEAGEPTRESVTAALEEIEAGGRLVINPTDGRGGAAMPHYWYRIGEDGAPVLLGRERASAATPRAVE